MDTDDEVLAAAATVRLDVNMLWISFGTDKHIRYISVHEIAKSLGPVKSKALPFVHASGCDTVSLCTRD